ncbi:MAG: peptide ABC transporter substrate-binding protein [Pseudobdellovibrionaceae bacterium]
MKRAILTVASLILVLGSVSAYAKPTNAELKIGIAQEFENFNPLVMSMVATTYMYGMVNRTLVVLDADGKWVPNLAKSIPTFENGGARFIGTGKDRKIEAVWEIKEEAKWGDGVPVTCGDLDLSLEIAKSPNVSIASKETYTMVEKISVDPKNPKKCTLLYSKPRWDYYQMGQYYVLPRHLEEAIFKKYGKQKEGYEKNSNYSRNPTNPGLYNGPYKITEVKLGSHVSFAVNPMFYGPKPKIQKIVVKLIPNTGTLEANLRSGTIDMISVLGLTFDQALAFEKKVKVEKLPYNVMFQSSLVYEHIDMNLDNPILKDIKVRKALITGINREDLVKALFEGRQTVAIHNMSPTDPWFTNDPAKITLYPHSRRNAQKLLDDAGWKPGPDGIRVKDGKRLSLAFNTTAGNKVRELVQVFLKDQWKQIGVDVQIKNEPARVFFGETTRKRKYEALAMYAWVSAPETVPRSTLASTDIPTDKNGFSGQNVPGWSNKDADQLITDLELEFDFNKRVALAHKLAKLYTEEAPVIPLYYRADVAVVPAHIKGFRLPGHLYSEAQHVENWDLGN